MPQDQSACSSQLNVTVPALPIINTAEAVPQANGDR